MATPKKTTTKKLPKATAKTFYPPKTFDDDLVALVDLYSSSKWSFTNVNLKQLTQDSKDQRSERQAFDALDKPTQAAVLKAGAAAETRGWKISEQKTGWYLDQLKANGMEIVKPGAQLTADLRKVGNFMLADWQKKAGDDGKRVIDAYRAMQ